MTAYDRLATRFARIATIGEASSVLGWDAATMMPPGGGAARGDQLAVLAGMSHSLLVAPVVGEDLDAAEAAGDTDPWRAANLRLMRHAYTRATAMPPDLVEAQAHAQLRLRESVARGAPPIGFRHGPPASRGGRSPDARGRGCIGTRAATRSVRRPDGWLPARHARPRCRQGVRRVQAFLRRALPEAEERQARHPPPLRPRIRSLSPSRRHCAAVSPSVWGSTRPRAAGPLGASVLRRHTL